VTSSSPQKKHHPQKNSYLNQPPCFQKKTQQQPQIECQVTGLLLRTISMVAKDDKDAEITRPHTLPVGFATCPSIRGVT